MKHNKKRREITFVLYCTDKVVTSAVLY